MGTNYYTSHYDDLKKQVLASHTEQVTALISFEYERTKAEWQAAIDNGENLLWDFDKVLRINTQSDDKLPEGTKLTLVDRNSKQAYFTEYNGSDDVLKFLDFDGYENNRSYLCDGLSMQAIEQNSETSGKVLYVEVNPNTNATLRIGEKYYRPAQSTDTGKKYSITVEGDGTDKFLLKEQFYLTIQTPETDTSKTAFVNVLIECESSLKNSKSSDMLPNKLERYTNKNWYTRNESENRIVIGDFFNETVMLSTSSEELMSETNNSITLDIQSKIEFRSQEWFKRYQSYAKGTSLYQRFDLQLNQWKPANKGNTANFAAGTVVKVEYFKDGASVAGGGTEMLPETSVVELKFPEAIDFNAGNATEGDSSLPSVTLKAEVTLTYDTGCIVNQFIERSESMAREGLQFLAYSHLAYSEDALKRSSVSKSVTDNSRRFYRENQEAATLLYNSYGIDEQTKMDQLGINGRSANEVAISTYATYDVSKLSAAAASATTLKYSFRLLRKDNKGKYVEVSSNASDLYRINNGSVTWLNSSQETVSSDKLSATSGSVSLTGGLDPNQGIEFNIPLNINTGTILEGQKEIYSNYQVELTVSLYKDETLITGSKVTDYVIYTNAKIKTELIE